MPELDDVVTIGMVRLTGLQDVRTVESRNLVEQRVPGQKGSVFQDLGRDPITFELVGLVFTDALTFLEQLRTAQSDAEPLLFSGGITTGTEVTRVLVEDLRVREEAGFPGRFRFVLRVREYFEPPEEPGLFDELIDDLSEALGGEWLDSVLGAADLLTPLLTDPRVLSAILSGDLSQLDDLAIAELGTMLSGVVGDLLPEQLGDLFTTLAEVDPQLVADLIAVARDGEGFEEFLRKYAEAGLELLGDLGLELGPAAAALVAAFAGGAEFLQALERVQDEADGVVEALRAIDPTARLADLRAAAGAAA